MGRERKANAAKAPLGVEIRGWKNSSTIRIHFSYKSVECRETLKIEATPTNLKYAERLRSEILNAIERGNFSYANYFPDSKRARMFGHVTTNITVGELLTEFLEQAERTLEYSTYDGYRKICRAHLFDAFGKLPIRELTPAYIRRWIKDLGIKAKTIRNILTPLRAVLDEAVNDDIISSNPLDKVKLNKILSKKAKRSDYDPDPFNINEITAILKYCDGQAHNLFKFAFFTGMRPSELIALEWKDIDWVNGLVCVRRAIVRKREKSTKTESGIRDIMLLAPALEALQAQKALTFLEGKRVFYNPRTGTPWETDAQIRKTCWTYILKKAGVRYRNPYQTRHTYASMMLTAGENMLWLAKQMGHRDTEMIIKTYGKWIPDPSTKSGYTTVNNWATALSTRQHQQSNR